MTTPHPAELTEAERAQWREDAAQQSDSTRWSNPVVIRSKRILALLDALEAAEQRAATAWSVHREHVDTSCQIIARHAGDATFAQIEARRLLEGIEALADKWERLARNGPATYTEIRRAHSAELRALLSTSSVRGEGDG